MLYRKKQLPELYFIRHRHNDNNISFDYENNILNKSLSPYMYKNDLMANFLDRLQPIVSLLFDNFNIIKNLKNYNVDKYHFNQK